MNSSSDNIPSLPPAARLTYIDTLRGLGAVAVFMTHVHSYWLGSVRPSGFGMTRIVTFLAGIGGLGVDLFIVLSGFCLFYPLLSRNRQEMKPFEPRSFYRRRAYRLLPAYYAALFVASCLAFTPALQPLLVSRPVECTDVLAYLFFLQTFSPVTTGSINGSFWSIALEVQLYLAFPILLFLYSRKGGIKTVLALSVIVAVLWEPLHQFLVSRGMAAFDSNLHLPAHWVQFAGGMAAAVAVRGSTPKYLLRAKGIFWMTLPATVVLHTGLTDNLPLWIPALVSAACFSALVTALSAYPERAFSGISPLAFLTLIGTISYSFYLLHQPFLLLTAPLVQSLHLGTLTAFASALLVGVPLMSLIASAFYFLIEKPFMEMGRQAVRRTKIEIVPVASPAGTVPAFTAAKVKDV